MCFKAYLGTQNISRKARRTSQQTLQGLERCSIWWAFWPSHIFSGTGAGRQVLAFIGLEPVQLHRNGLRLGIFQPVEEVLMLCSREREGCHGIQLFYLLFKNFVEVQLKYDKLHVHKVYNLVSLTCYKYEAIIALKKANLYHSKCFFVPFSTSSLILYYKIKFSRILCKWNYIMYTIFFLVYSFLTPHSPPSTNAFEIHPCCCRYKQFVPLDCWLIVHCINISQFVYSFTCCRTFGLLSNFGCYKYNLI